MKKHLTLSVVFLLFVLPNVQGDCLLRPDDRMPYSDGYTYCATRSLIRTCNNETFEDTKCPDGQQCYQDDCYDSICPETGMATWCE